MKARCFRKVSVRGFFPWCVVFLGWVLGDQAVVQRGGAHPSHEPPEVQSGAAVLADAILNEHPYLVEPEYRQVLESWIRADALTESSDGLNERLTELLDLVQTTVVVDMNSEAEPHLSRQGPISLPGDRGGVLFKVSNGPGPVSFTTARADLAITEGWVSIPVASSGTTWSLLTLKHVPDGLTSLFASFEEESGSIGAFQFQVTAPLPGCLVLTVLSDDTNEPTPAIIQLKSLSDGSLRRPDNAIDFTPQFDSQAAAQNRAEGSRLLNLPGLPEGDYWVVPGPIDMMMPPGRWQISILRGLEHLPVVETVEIRSGQTTVVACQPERWVDMAARGWYSGDDHVHARVMSQGDADNLLTWALAEDLRVVNVLEMGDHARTFFQQRAFGRDARIISMGTVLVPGQEDPRIGQLGHTIALNISELVRDTSKYYLHDWYYDRVHQLGGLYGYAHVNRGLFNIHRDMSLNLPLGKVDFVELLQFHELGTALYYDFLNLGFKITASAGSDVPWGATIGEVRVYAFLGDGDLAGDGWFQAVEKGRTFVTNGPMVEFSIDDALPGDEIQLTDETPTLKVKARAWGHPDRSMPTRLEIVKQGEVIRTVTESTSPTGELQLEFELDAGMGSWLAARASADDGSVAHTTPIYVSRAPLRFWDYEQVPELIDRRLLSLDEIDQLIEHSRQAEPTRSDEFEVSGVLAGGWYGNADLTRPQGIDTLHLPMQTWPVPGQRGGAWSAQWKGVLTLPKDVPEKVTFHLDSTGPSTLVVNGRELIAKGASGEESATIELKPGFQNEVRLTYVNLRSPRSYLGLSWSADGIDKQPVPPEWFSIRKQDRAAFRFAAGTGLEVIQLREQTDQLLERVARARLFYEDLHNRWLQEKDLREK